MRKTISMLAAVLLGALGLTVGFAPAAQAGVQSGSLLARTFTTGGPANQTFQMTASCTAQDADGPFSTLDPTMFSLDATGPNSTHNISGILAGSTCTVTEADPGAGWSVETRYEAAAFTPGFVATGPIVASQQRAFDFQNTFTEPSQPSNPSQPSQPSCPSGASGSGCTGGVVPTVCNGLTLSKNIAAPKDQVTVTATGKCFEPGHHVDLSLHSLPAALGQTTANATGGISMVVTIPADAPAGSDHSIHADQSDTAGVNGHLFAAITITGVAAGTLPRTGGDALPYAVVAGLVLAGTSGLVLRRRTVSR